MFHLSGTEIRNLFVGGEKTAEEIASYFLKRARFFDKEVKAFLTLFDERMMKKAKELDQKKREGKPLGKLAGIPIAIKDNMHMKGEVTSCASKLLENYKAPFDATAIKRIEEEDGLILGKTNLDEFAMGSSNEKSAFHNTYNPWDLSLTPGGSSGGSAAAVAARLVPIALGSDTGGSIRQPASFTGTIGLKPTYGRVSRFGLVAFASSLDQIGPITHSVEDNALIMEVIGVNYSMDATSLKEKAPNFTKSLSSSLKGKKVGVPLSSLDDLTDEVRYHFEESLNTLKTLGVEIVEIKLPLLKFSVPVYYILCTGEASANLARFDGVQYGKRSKEAETLDQIYNLSREEGFGKEVKQRILLGTYMLSSGFKEAYYKKANDVRFLIKEEYKNAFKACDMITLPTTAAAAFKIGSIADPLAMYLQDVYTISSNLTGCPAISVPLALDQNKRPLGLQFMAPFGEDEIVLAMAHHFTKEKPLSPSIPPLFDKEAP